MTQKECDAAKAAQKYAIRGALWGGCMPSIWAPTIFSLSKHPHGFP
jgi:hypothetical protein